MVRPTGATFVVAMNRVDVVELVVDLVDVDLDVDLVDVDLAIDLVDVDLDVEVSNFRNFEFSKTLLSRFDALDRLYRSE